MTNPLRAADPGPARAWNADTSVFLLAHGHQGGGHDASSGLLLFRHRYLSPNLMRWTSRDPAGYVDGGSLLQYVGGDPVRWVDPEGALRRVPVDVVPRPSTRPSGQHSGGSDDKKKKDSERRTNAPIYWSRVYRDACVDTNAVDSASVEDMVRQMLYIARKRGNTSRWTIRSHGSPIGVFVGNGDGGTEAIRRNNLHLLDPLKNYFTEDAELVIWACKCGANDAFMQELADRLQIRVTAFDENTEWAFKPWGPGKWKTWHPRPSQQAVPAAPTEEKE